jgi:hypothetical protein
MTTLKVAALIEFLSLASCECCEQFQQPRIPSAQEFCSQEGYPPGTKLMLYDVRPNVWRVCHARISHLQELLT